MTEKVSVVCATEVREFVSLLKDIPVNVAMQALSQYPEFMKMIKEQLESNDEIIKKVIAVNQQNAQECFLYYQEVLRDISICLEDKTLDYEQRLRLIEKEIEIAQLVGQKETELREMNQLLVKGER